MVSIAYQKVSFLLIKKKPKNWRHSIYSLICFLLDFFFFFPLEHPSRKQRSPKLMKGTCRAAQRLSRDAGSCSGRHQQTFLLVNSPCSPGVTSLQHLTQGDPSASSAGFLSSALSWIPDSGGFSSSLQELLLSGFPAAPAHLRAELPTLAPTKSAWQAWKLLDLKFSAFKVKPVALTVKTPLVPRTSDLILLFWSRLSLKVHELCEYSRFKNKKNIF